MRKLIFTLFVIAFAASCSQEKFVTVDHSVKAEFGQDMPEGSMMSVVCLDARGGTMTSSQIIANLKDLSSSLVFILCDAEVDGVPAGKWLKDNCSEWGHMVSYAVDGFMGSSSMDNAYFEALSLPSGDKLLAEAADYSFVFGNVQESDKKDFATETIHDGTNSRWIVLSPSKSDFLTEYTFTDCLSAQNGATEDDSAQHQMYVYAYQGVWSRMSYIYESPLSFGVNVEQE
jgi:hypothetical protein